MKYLNLIILLLYAVLGFAQIEVNEYVEFLEKQKTTPKEYIFELFRTNDIIILGERDHRDTTQYDLILDIIKDKRFIENVGYVYTEKGVINKNEWANKIIKGNFKNKRKFNKEFVKLYRELDWTTIWDKYNMIKYLKGVYNINKDLDETHRITIGLTDCSFEWKGMTHNKYQEFINTNLVGLRTRDSIMANNFIKLYKKQNVIKGHRKALIIQSRPHAINLNTTFKSYKIKRFGTYIKEKYKKEVKIIMFNWYNWVPKDWNSIRYGIKPKTKLINDGKWDAAYEIINKKAIGFNIINTPFGKTPFDYQYDDKILYQDIVDGIIYYKPFYNFNCSRGLPNMVDLKFAKELIKRNDIVNGNNNYSSKWKPKEEKDDWDEFKCFECVNYKKLKEQMNKWLN